MKKSENVLLAILLILLGATYTAGSQTLPVLNDIIGVSVKSQEFKAFAKSMKRAGFKLNKKAGPKYVSFKGSNTYLELYHGYSGMDINYVFMKGGDWQLTKEVSTARLPAYHKEFGNIGMMDNCLGNKIRYLIPNGYTLLKEYPVVSSTIDKILKNDGGVTYIYGPDKTEDTQVDLARVVRNPKAASDNRRLESVKPILSGKVTLPFGTKTCLSGDCNSTTSSYTARYVESSDDSIRIFEGAVVGGLPNGRGILSQQINDVQVIFEGTFKDGVPTGLITIRNKTDDQENWSIDTELNEWGQPITMVREETIKGKKYKFEWSPAHNKYYDLSGTDPGSYPGDIKVTAYNATKKNGYDYILQSSGTFFPLCLHNFNTCGEYGGYPLRSKVLKSEGKDRFGNYFVEGSVLHYQNGKDSSSDGAKFIEFDSCEIEK